MRASALGPAISRSQSAKHSTCKPSGASTEYLLSLLQAEHMPADLQEILKRKGSSIKAPSLQEGPGRLCCQAMDSSPLPTPYLHAIQPATLGGPGLDWVMLFLFKWEPEVLQKAWETYWIGPGDGALVPHPGSNKAAPLISVRAYSVSPPVCVGQRSATAPQHLLKS